MPTPKLPCGCVDNSKLAATDGRRDQKCEAHARPRYEPRCGAPRSVWMRENACPFCDRVNRSGCACADQHVNTCPTCGLQTCHTLDMGHFYLTRQLGLICPATINRRTAAGRRDQATIDADPAKNAALVDFPGKARAPAA